MIELRIFFFEVIESFLVTLGYGFVFYLLIKKLQKTWPTLVILVAIFALVVLSLWWWMFGVENASDAIGDVTGIYLAIAALAALFHFNSLGLKAAPEDTSLFHGDVKDTKKQSMHLGRLLQVSILIEERAADFYHGLAKRVSSPDVKRLCQRLAEDEVRHKEFIERNLFRWLPLTMDRQSLALFEKELTISGIFLNPPAQDCTEGDLVKYAIEQEEMMANFYLSFEKAFPSGQKRLNIQLLAMGERKHASDLISSYQQLKDKAKP